MRCDKMEVKKEEVQQAQHSMEVSNAHKSSLGGETQRVAGHNNKKEVQGYYFLFQQPVQARRSVNDHCHCRTFKTAYVADYFWSFFDL